MLIIVRCPRQEISYPNYHLVLEKINVIKRFILVNNDRGRVFNDFILRTKYTCKHANAQNIMSFLTLGIHISLWSYYLVNTYFRFFLKGVYSFELSA